MADQPTEDHIAAGLALTEFIAIPPCAMHDAHNAFRWGFLSEVKNRDLMRDVYVSVESLRSSSDILGKHIWRMGGNTSQLVQPSQREVGRPPPPTPSCLGFGTRGH